MYLIERDKQQITCGTLVTVQHIIADCRSFDDARTLNNILISLAEALGPDPISIVNCFYF